jgi:hypothetical protein
VQVAVWRDGKVVWVDPDEVELREPPISPARPASS